MLKVVVPDELHGSILTKTVPARPQMTTKEVCKIIAHKARITNPQDYALYRLTDGEGKIVFFCLNELKIQNFFFRNHVNGQRMSSRLYEGRKTHHVSLQANRR